VPSSAVVPWVMVAEPVVWRRLSPGWRPAQSLALNGPSEGTSPTEGIAGQLVVSASTLELGAAPSPLR
jgi:hypothetical protein